MTNDSHATPEAIRAAVMLLIEHGDGPVLAVADGLSRWLDQAPGEAASLDAVLGMPWRWRQARLLRQRDELLVQIARQHFPALATRAAARAMADAFHRYATAGWVHDRASRQRPKNGLPGDLFDALSLGDAPGEAMLRVILAG